MLVCTCASQCLFFSLSGSVAVHVLVQALQCVLVPWLASFLVFFLTHPPTLTVLYITAILGFYASGIAAARAWLLERKYGVSACPVMRS